MKKHILIFILFIFLSPSIFSKWGFLNSITNNTDKELEFYYTNNGCLNGINTKFDEKIEMEPFEIIDSYKTFNGVINLINKTPINGDKTDSQFIIKEKDIDLEYKLSIKIFSSKNTDNGDEICFIANLESIKNSSSIKKDIIIKNLELAMIDFDIQISVDKDSHYLLIENLEIKLLNVLKD